MSGKCPQCKKILSSVTCERIDVQVLMGNSWKGMACKCPYCETVINVQVDPAALRADILNGLLEIQRNWDPNADWGKCGELQCS